MIQHCSGSTLPCIKKKRTLCGALPVLTKVPLRPNKNNFRPAVGVGYAGLFLLKTQLSLPGSINRHTCSAFTPPLPNGWGMHHNVLALPDGQRACTYQ